MTLAVNLANVSSAVTSTASSGATSIAGVLTATSFSGAGTGLTGTASSLSIGGSAGSVAASALTGTTLSSGVVTSSLTSVGTLTGLTVSTATGRVGTGTDAGGSISLGLSANPTSTTPYVDFNTSAIGVDYNVRIKASGNTAVVGSGTLSVEAASSTFSGNVSISGSNGITTSKLIFSDNTTQTTAAASTGKAIAMSIVFGG